MTRVTKEDFLKDPTGAKFVDVVNNHRVDFQAWLDFFNDKRRQLRMEDAEEHHLRPALAGVVRELEGLPVFSVYLSSSNSNRGRQAIGVLVRIYMEKLGWKQTGRKGSLGQCLKSDCTSDPDKMIENTSGLSKWFKKAEHYQRAG
ncbi:MAG: hypothetical protein EOM80_14965 [Erysipelotrichia bacterium]|nr:hypothetical protein [Erysipelotrichia bacterium]